MSELPFGSGLVGFLADHRHPLLTPFFQLFTFLGEIEGYVLLVALVYVAFDKRLAVRLAVLTLVAMSLNHFLKELIQNPRPFVDDGSYAARWAVSPAKAVELATEFSTPSGHAMAGGAFYACLYASVAHPGVRIAAVALLLLTGLSRPYLGVHYLEDVLLGWPLGIALALLAVRYAEPLRRFWDGFSHARQIALSVAASVALWAVTRVLGGFHAEGNPTAFVSYLGFLTGIVVAKPLEERWVGFDPTRGTRAEKALRYVTSVALVLATLSLLDQVAGALAEDGSPPADLLRYLRYATASVVAFLAAPFVFTTWRFRKGTDLRI